MTSAPINTADARPGEHASSLVLAFRYALRELRGGLSGFYVFIACIALGVMAIAGVGSVAGSLADGLAAQGRVILGGDIAFTLIQREASAKEKQFLVSQGSLSVAATMRAMARATDGRLALVEVKAVDRAYPLVGNVVLDKPQPLSDALAERDGAFGAIADPALLVRLDLKAGDRITVGRATFEIRSALMSEPDKLAGSIGFGPRLLIGETALRATGLLQPGSLVRWTYRLVLPDKNATDQAANAVADNARRVLPQAGWGIRTRANASPQLGRSIGQFTQYLTLVGLAALLVGGVGVANAVRSLIDRRRNVIATFKALGASGNRVFTIYLVQILMLAGMGSLIGIAIGSALPFVISWGFGKLIPWPVAPSIHGGVLMLALAYGIVTALAFALWPLGRAHDVPVSELFRNGIATERRWPRQRYFFATALLVVMLAALAVGTAYDRKVAVIFIGAACAVFVLLRLIAAGLMRLAARLPRPRFTMLRLAIANIHRPGAITPSVVLSLGLGLALLVTITQIDANLRRQFTAALPAHAPSFYFVDIPSTDIGAFKDFIVGLAPNARAEQVPMLRGRIVSARGIAADRLKPSRDAAWVLQSDRGITYANDVPRGSRVVEGDWWPKDYGGPPLVSFEKNLAAGLGLSVGDTLVVNVLGRNVTATIANLREVDWQSLGINFFMVFSPNVFRGAPHSHIATLTDPGADSLAEARMMKAVAARYPMVTSVRVREVLETIGGVIRNLTLGIRSASAVTLISAMLVLGGALAAGHRHRVYDAVILKTLGATRKRLLIAYALEYGLIGLIAALFAVLAGSVAAWAVVTRLMSLGFVWFPWSATAIVVFALLLTVTIGLIGTLSALGEKPARVLRGL